MTINTSAAGGFHAPSADRPRAGNAASRLLTFVGKRLEKRRQRLALDRLDDRLRMDIGLPPR